jgi:ribosomal protein S14
MKRLKFKYKKFYKIFHKNELFFKTQTYIKNNTLSPPYLRQYSLLYLSDKKGYTYLIKNYCLLSGKTRYVIKSSNTSRMFFKELIEKANLTGFYKNS